MLEPENGKHEARDIFFQTWPFTLRRDLLSVSRVWFISEIGSIHASNSQDLCYITIPSWRMTMSRDDCTKNPSRSSVSLHWSIKRNPRMERLRQGITLQSLPRWMERACKLDGENHDQQCMAWIPRVGLFRVLVRLVDSFSKGIRRWLMINCYEGAISLWTAWKTIGSRKQICLLICHTSRVG